MSWTRGDELWVSVATTDRSEAFAALCGDLGDQSQQAGVPLRLLVVENSRRPDSRAANVRTLDATSARGIAVVRVESPVAPESIAKSRLRQRELIRATLRSCGRPRLVWMLDDDMRLGHHVWAGGALQVAHLQNHLGFLRELGRARPAFEVLIGKVSGDPPIPALATLTTRFGDLLMNLRRMFGSAPEARWAVRPSTLELLGEQDAYYDLSSTRRAPAWLSHACWLPRVAGATVGEACREMLANVEHLPFGVAFTRPILAEPTLFAEFTEGTMRGGNAVFFDVEACLSHDYPVAFVGGVETRRCDMIGTALLAAQRSVRVRTSGFSVAHTRSIEARRPGADELHRTLLADTIGAQLAREVGARLTSTAPSRDFWQARLKAVRASLSHLAETLVALSRLVSRAPAWASADHLAALRDVLHWAASCLGSPSSGSGPSAAECWADASEIHAGISARAQELVERVAA